MLYNEQEEPKAAMQRTGLAFGGHQSKFGDGGSSSLAPLCFINHSPSPGHSHLQETHARNSRNSASFLHLGKRSISFEIEAQSSLTGRLGLALEVYNLQRDSLAWKESRKIADTAFRYYSCLSVLNLRVFLPGSILGLRGGSLPSRSYYSFKPL